MSSDKIPIDKLFDPYTITQFQSFVIPGESYDTALLRLLRISNTSSISVELTDRLSKIGQAGETINDVVENLLNYYLDETLNYGVRTYVQSREAWNKVKAKRDSEKFNKPKKKEG